MRKETDPSLNELVAIRKLLVLALLRSGMTQTQIAGALEIGQSGVSKMFPKGILNSISKKTDID